jgi:hypothetical protein
MPNLFINMVKIILRLAMFYTKIYLLTINSEHQTSRKLGSGRFEDHY